MSMKMWVNCLYGILPNDLAGPAVREIMADSCRCRLGQKAKGKKCRPLLHELTYGIHLAGHVQGKWGARPLPASLQSGTYGYGYPDPSTALNPLRRYILVDAGQNVAMLFFGTKPQRACSPAYSDCQRTLAFYILTIMPLLSLNGTPGSQQIVAC